MKKSLIALIISILVLATTILWFLSSKSTVSFRGIAEYGVILVLVAFGFYVCFSRLRSAKRGEPAEDELSKKIMQKASSISYYISLYLWLAVMYYSDKIKMETHTLIGTGILGMAIIFCGCWIFYKIRGMRDA
jgi:peptidoglycan/LPS O-acetylase OafA/YrhL